MSAEQYIREKKKTAAEDDKTLMMDQTVIMEEDDYIGDPAFDSAKKADDAKPSRELYQLSDGVRLAGKYMIRDVIDFGGFGIVYSAIDINLDKKVAVKEYYPANLINRIPGSSEVEIFAQKQKGEFEKGLSRFLEEARNMAKFSEVPNIVSVYDFFKENGTAYLVMEFLDGKSLKKYTEDKGGRLPYQEVIRITKDVIKALKVLHAQHILHRDISPDNIFICRDGTVKLIDYGAARFALGSETDKTLSVILKPGYAPPEQYRSKGGQGPWTDIYALGATMYKVVTGITPDESVNRTKKDELKEPKEIVSQIPEYFNKILMKCMALQPQLRFQTVADLESKLDKKKKVASVQTELFRRRFLRAALIVLLLVLFGTAGYQEYQYIQRVQRKATLVPCQVSVWLPMWEGQDEVEAKELFHSGIADFYEDYPNVGVEIQCIPEAEYAERLKEAAEEAALPAIYDTQYLEGSQVQRADISEVYEMLDDSQYVMELKSDNVYKNRNLPTGFDVPILYRNTSADTWCEENDLNEFLNGRASAYVGTVGDYLNIQSHLAGVYSMESIQDAAIGLVHIWAVNGTESEDVQNAAVRLLYYFVSQRAQEEWFLQGHNGLPLYKEAYQTYLAINPELSFLEDMQIETDNSIQTGITEDYKEELYEILKSE